MPEIRITITSEDRATRTFKAVQEASRMASGGVEQFGESCKRSGGKATDFIKGLVGFEALKRAASWLKDVSGGFLDAASTTEQYRTRLSVLLGDVREGNRLFDEMADYAGRVPFQYEEIMGAATQLSGVMKGGVDEVKQWMPLIGDLAAASGLSIQQTTEQVSRMYSSGAASADMFRERGILAMMGFEAGVSYSAEETRKKMFEEWQKAGSQFKGATEALADDWDGLTSMMADKWFKWRTQLMESGVFDYMKFGLGKINKWLDEAFKSGRAEKWALETAQAVIWVVEKAAWGVGILIDSFRGLKMIFLTLKWAFYEVQTAIFEGILFLNEKLTGLMEKFNFKGVFDEQIKNGQLWREEIVYGLEEMQSQASSAKDKLLEMAREGMATSRIKEFVDAAKRGIAEMQQARDEANKKSAAAGGKGKGVDPEQARADKLTEYWQWYYDEQAVMREADHRAAMEQSAEWDVEEDARLQALHNSRLASKMENEALMAQAEEVFRGQRLAAARGFFANLTTMQGTFGKIGLLGQKVLALKETYINTRSAAVAAYKALAGIPIVGPALGAAAAAAAVAYGTQQFTEISGIAHGGLERVPREGTYILNKDERVLAPPQNKDLTAFLARQDGGGRGNMYIENLYVTVKDYDEFVIKLSSFTRKHARRGVNFGFVPSEA